MDNANDRQVGGTHYKSGFQHWDFVILQNLSYLPAQVTRYIARWRRKNGLEDLEKAKHYMDKLIADALVQHETANRLVENFVREGAPFMGPDERSVFNMLVNYALGDLDRLYVARACIERLIETEKARLAEQSKTVQQDIDELFSTKENLNA